MSALTRKDCEDQLPDGTDPLVVALHVAATSGERAASRRAAVLSAVTAWLGPDSPRELVAAALTAELGGVGGRMGFGVDGSGGTCRMRWARTCGKGRRFATDGGAWDSAMEAVLAEIQADVTTDSVIKLSERCDSSDIAWPLALCLRRAYMFRDTAPVAGEWARAARTIAAQCEPDTDAGRLAGRYELPTRRLLIAPIIHAHFGEDYDPPIYMIEEIVEAFLGVPLWEAPADWPGQEWRMEDGNDTALHIVRDGRLGCFRIDIRSREVGNPSCIAAVRAAWVHRTNGKEFEAEIIAAHEAHAWTHPDMLRAMRAQWDAEFGVL